MLSKFNVISSNYFHQLLISLIFVVDDDHGTFLTLFSNEVLTTESESADLPKLSFYKMMFFTDESLMLIFLYFSKESIFEKVFLYSIHSEDTWTIL
jgi:hypothetical protein